MPPDEVEPTVIAKPETPFFFTPKFLGGGAVLLVLLLIGFGSFVMLRKQPSTQPSPSQIAQKEQPKPIKGLIGIVQAVDTRNNMITVKEKDHTNSYQVSNDVLISRMILGIKSKDNDMKQFTIPTEILYLEDLAKKKGSEVYLVFDSNAKNVIQIQMYPKK